ncbi:hypothetical protein [Rhodococcus jostii]|uniref:Uncharacterized protein n=1 Tax=Rhodococcus jostii TaxID=132919 RepID=A0A1H5MJJ8_RHOJO|nr:hypothetical protein [Rhodococcus jostii]SEE89486.1 hypothetical protein SAMN04490220_9052 [Rhodococcus jostii]
MSTMQLHPITHSTTSTSWKRLVAVAAATVALGLIPVGAANATTAQPNAAQPVAAAVTHDSPLDRDNDMQQQRRHDRQRDERQDRRAETTVLDQVLVGWNSSTLM